MAAGQHNGETPLLSRCNCATIANAQHNKRTHPDSAFSPFNLMTHPSSADQNTTTTTRMRKRRRSSFMFWCVAGQRRQWFGSFVVIANNSVWNSISVQLEEKWRARWSRNLFICKKQSNSGRARLKISRNQSIQIVVGGGGWRAIRRQNRPDWPSMVPIDKYLDITRRNHYNLTHKRPPQVAVSRVVNTTAR